MRVSRLKRLTCTASAFLRTVSSDCHEFTRRFEFNGHKMEIFELKTNQNCGALPSITIIKQIAQYCESPGFSFHWYAPLAATRHIFNVRLNASDHNSLFVPKI